MTVRDDVARAKPSCTRERLAVVAFCRLTISRCDIPQDAKDEGFESPCPLLTGELKRFLGVAGGLSEAPGLDARQCRPTERRWQHVAPLLLAQALEAGG